jgi:hypothetical protein
VSQPIPDRVPLRNSDGRLLRHVCATEAARMLATGVAEPVGRSAVRYLRLTGAAKVKPWMSEANFTVRRRGNTFEHITRRCNSYGPGSRAEAA